jgi:phage-related protein
MKKVVWVGSSRRDVEGMPEEVREAIGFGLYCAERGIVHASMKTLKGFGGASVQEIKADDAGGTHRAVYTVKFKGYLYVLHVFQKKSKEGSKTPKRDMELILERLAWAVEDFKTRS